MAAIRNPKGIRRWWWLLIVVALVAAACGGNDDDGSAVTAELAEAQEQTAEPAEAPAEAPAEESGEAPTEEAADEPAEESGEQPADESAEEPAETPAEPTPEPTPVVLTASYQGVTESEIGIGVAAIDPVQINEMFGIDIGIFPVHDLYAALSADLNERGGIHGRNVVVHVVSFLPIGTTDSERVCTELIEDEKVFVVIGQFLEDNALCITELHGHPYVGHFGENAERQERSNGLFFATEMKQTRQRVGGTTEMIRAGDFDGHRVGIYYEAPPTRSMRTRFDRFWRKPELKSPGSTPRRAHH